METTIRRGKSPFYGDHAFSHGIARSGYFNYRESQELEDFGYTLSALLDGTLQPDNEEELKFVQDMKSSEPSNIYAVKLWKKYLDCLAKSKVLHGFAKSSGHHYKFAEYMQENMAELHE